MEDFSGLIFVILFIAFSVVEGIGRKRKAQQKGGAAQKPAPRTRETASPRRQSAAAGPPAPVSQQQGGQQVPAKDGGSEGLIPKEIWDEILGLARGAPPGPQKAPTGTATPPRLERREETLEEVDPVEVRTLEPLDVQDERLTPGRERAPFDPETYARDRPRSPDTAIALRSSGKEAVATARGRTQRQADPEGGIGQGHPLRGELFRDGSPAELRRAIVLSEVLGPPVGMRE